MLAGLGSQSSGCSKPLGVPSLPPAFQLPEFFHATPLNELGAERTAGREIPSSLLCTVRPRYRENGVGRCKFASACFSAYSENSRICLGSLPIAFGSSVPFQALFRARLLVGLRRPAHSSADRRIVRRRRKATPRGAGPSARLPGPIEARPSAVGGQRTLPRGLLDRGARLTQRARRAGWEARTARADAGGNAHPRRWL
jgi:hypothetical protein